MRLIGKDQFFLGIDKVVQHKPIRKENGDGIILSDIEDMDIGILRRDHRDLHLLLFLEDSLVEGGLQCKLSLVFNVNRLHLGFELSRILKGRRS